jgi:hypothetical protein
LQTHAQVELQLVQQPMLQEHKFNVQWEQICAQINKQQVQVHVLLLENYVLLALQVQQVSFKLEFKQMDFQTTVSKVHKPQFKNKHMTIHQIGSLQLLQIVYQLYLHNLHLIL